MDFSISEEQSMLADSVSRFIEQDYDFERRMSIAEDDGWFSDEVWQSFAELGITAALFSEEDGGLGGGAVELMLIMEQLGRGLVVEPFVANVVLAGGVLKRAGSTEQKEELLAGIIAGTSQAALAFAEPQGRFDAADIATTATVEVRRSGHRRMTPSRTAIRKPVRRAEADAGPAGAGGARTGGRKGRTGGQGPRRCG